MSLKYRLTGIIFAVITVIIAALVFFTVTRSSKLQTETVLLYADALAGKNAKEIQRRIEIYAHYGQIFSMIMNNFETTDINLRRDSYEAFMLSAIEQNESIIGIWSAWLPNVIDNLDGERGQFKPFYTRRRTGSVELIENGYDNYNLYLRGMVASGNPILEDPVWREVHGRGIVPVVSIQFPVKTSAGTVVGVFGITYISAMQEIVDEISRQVYDGKGIAGVYSSDGVIVAHYDSERVGNNIKTYEGEVELLGDMHTRVVESIRNGGENGHSVSIDRYSPLLKTDIHLIYHPIHITGINNPWCLLLGIPKNIIDRPINDMMWYTLLIAGIILVLAAVIIYIVALRIANPIIDVTRTLKDISEGEGDLTKRIINNSKDEVGDLSRYFNLTLDKIKSLVILIKQETLLLSDIGQDLASNMNETAAAINEITDNIQNIKGRVVNQSASVTETHATMEQVTGNINKLNAHVEDQSIHISTISSAIEEMVSNIKSVTSTLVKNSENVNSLKEASENGRSGLQDVAQDIKEIARESEGLLEINSVMENIASQTNLLSMNAAIEAAHAGESGKGFAVVAGEIRKLAASAGEQSKTIGIVLKKIKESIDKITRSTENVLNRFEVIDNNVRTVSQQEEAIRGAMEEQGEGSKQLLEGVAMVNETTRQVKSGSNEMLIGAKEVIEESTNLEIVTQDISLGVNEMTSGAGEINLAVNHVKEISSKNRKGIDILMHEVSRFKVE